jgi:hypothetical protein
LLKGISFIVARDDDGKSHFSISRISAKPRIDPLG